RSPGGFERLQPVLLGLPFPSSPSRDSSTAVERSEAALVVIGFDDRECLVGELCGADELTVQRGRDLGKRREGSALDVAGALHLGLLRDDAHLVAYDGEVLHLPGGARREIPTPQGRLELDGAEQELARREVRLPRERALACSLERLRGHARQLLGRMSVELGV